MQTGFLKIYRRYSHMPSHNSELPSNHQRKKPEKMFTRFHLKPHGSVLLENIDKDQRKCGGCGQVIDHLNGYQMYDVFVDKSPIPQRIIFHSQLCKVIHLFCFHSCFTACFFYNLEITQI